jgi:hypothetical protein
MVDLKRRGFLARMLAAPAAVPVAVEALKATPVLPEAPVALPAAVPSFNVARPLAGVTGIWVSGCFAQADTSVRGVTVTAHMSPVESPFGSGDLAGDDDDWYEDESESWEDDDDDA